MENITGDTGMTITVASYLMGIPPGNKNPEKPAMLQKFVEGVNKVGDIGKVSSGDWEESDVAIVQGYVHEDSPNTPHLLLRKRVIDKQKEIGKRTIIIDSNLFLYIDKNNPLKYLRYSLDGVFPTTGNYFSNNPEPNRWKEIFQKTEA